MTDSKAPARFSVYTTPALARVLDARAKPGPDAFALRSRSAWISVMCERYAEIVDRAMPTFSRSEWCCILDALNGVWRREPAAHLTGLWAEIADFLEMSGGREKWSLADATLGLRIRALPYCSIVAIADAAERWWADPARGSDLASVAEIVGAQHVTED